MTRRTLSFGLIGRGARGINERVPTFRKLNGPFTAVRDVWRTRAEKAAANSPEAKVFGNHQPLLELPGLDALVIATSDHWRFSITIDALSSGKDVHVERPLTLKIQEGANHLGGTRESAHLPGCTAPVRSSAQMKGTYS